MKNRKRFSKTHEEIYPDINGQKGFKSGNYEVTIPTVFPSAFPEEDKPYHTKNSFGNRLREIASHAFRLLEHTLPQDTNTKIRSMPVRALLKGGGWFSTPNSLSTHEGPIRYNIEHSDIGGFIHGLSQLLGHMSKSSGIKKIEGKTPEEITYSIAPGHDMYIDDPTEHEKYIKTLQKHIEDTPTILKTYLSHRFSTPEFYKNELFKEDDDKSEKEDFRHFLMNHPEMKDKEHLNDYGYLLTGHY